uniref:Uncharacterized protein n=1 Tax=Plectus sambesii TaxID=2011161 RepID=A0A914WJI6_9BILA
MADGSTRKSLQMLLESVDGLFQLFVADREGVPIVTVTAANNAETLLRPQLLTSYQAAIEQSSKLGLGGHKQMVCSYGTLQLVLFNISPLTVTLIASSQANTGLLLGLRDQIEPIAEQINQAVATALPRAD